MKSFESGTHKAEMLVHGTAQLYEETYSPDVGWVDPQPSKRDGSEDTRKSRTSKARSLNKDALPSHKRGEADEAAAK